MDNLSAQRETIGHAKQSLEETQSNLKKSMRVANNMARRIVQNRILFYAIIVCLALFILLVVYLKFFR
jgi:t-SNARE complex subunit (syntaxin)